ncbi:MAG: PspA/IM30 family protein [Acidobacteriota bacterium]
MNLTQRFCLLVKGSLSSLFDAMEDPERSLHQLVVEMEEQLEVAKRAVAQAMANEERLRARIDRHQQSADQWQEAARRAVGKGRDAEAREALRQGEIAERQAQRLREQLAAQEQDTAQIRESVGRLHEQLQQGRSRLQVLQARLRQGEARRAMGKVMRGVASSDLSGELDRIGERVELWAAEEGAYLKLGDELSGADLKRRYETAAIEDAVDDQLAQLRAEVAAEKAAS